MGRARLGTGIKRENARRFTVSALSLNVPWGARLMGAQTRPQRLDGNYPEGLPMSANLRDIYGLFKAGRACLNRFKIAKTGLS
jgi:hypothetical protein